MKKLLSSTAIAGCLALGAAFSNASAARAVDFGSSWDGPGKSLQEQLDAITTSGPNIDTVGGQTGYDLFTNTASGGSVATFMFEIAGFAQTNKFGIYNQSGAKAQLFGGPNDVSDQALVSFNNGKVFVTTLDFTSDGNDLTSSTTKSYNNFGNIFGFYLEREDGVTFYTENGRNTDGSQQAVVYQGNNQTQLQIPGKSAGTFTDNEFIIAFEDLLRSIPGESDSDFNDLVVIMESIEPSRIPEPSTVSALVALGLCGASLTLKKQGQRSKKLGN